MTPTELFEKVDAEGKAIFDHETKNYAGRKPWGEIAEGARIEWRRHAVITGRVALSLEDA